MRWLVGSSLRYRWLVVFGAVALMVYGVSDVRSTPVDVFPEFAPPRVEIQTLTLGLSAEVEEPRHCPLEQNLAGVENLDVVRSTSVEQLSSITLLFERGTDWLQARQLVQERLATVAPTLPSWAALPFMMQPLSSTSRTMKIGLSSERYSLIELSSLVRHKIRPRLLRVPVWRTSVSGETAASGVIAPRSTAHGRHGVSVDQVLRVTADALDAPLLKHSPGSIVGTGGFVDTPNQRIAIRHVLPVVGPESLAEVGFTAPNGRRLRLDDIADIETGHPRLSATPSSTTAPACCSSSRSSRRRTRSRSRGESRKRSTRCGPG